MGRSEQWRARAKFTALRNCFSRGGSCSRARISRGTAEVLKWLAPPRATGCFFVIKGLRESLKSQLSPGPWISYRRGRGIFLAASGNFRPRFSLLNCPSPLFIQLHNTAVCSIFDLWKCVLASHFREVAGIGMGGLDFDDGTRFSFEFLEAGDRELGQSDPWMEAAEGMETKYIDIVFPVWLLFGRSVFNARSTLRSL